MVKRSDALQLSRDSVAAMGVLLGCVGVNAENSMKLLAMRLLQDIPSPAAVGKTNETHQLSRHTDTPVKKRGYPQHINRGEGCGRAAQTQKSNRSKTMGPGVSVYATNGRILVHSFQIWEHGRMDQLLIVRM